MQLVTLRLLIVLGFGLWFTSQALAAEQRCTELGVACVCSEPLNTTNLVRSGSWYNPGDSTTKECMAERGATLHGYAIRNGFLRSSANPTPGSADPVGSNDSLLLGRLPKHTSALQYVLRFPDNYGGSLDLTHRQADFTTTPALRAIPLPGNFVDGAGSEFIEIARAAMRVYVYHSDNFQFTDNVTCTNSKLIFGDESLSTSHEEGTRLNTYNFAWFVDSTCSAMGLPSGCGQFKLNGVGGTNLVNDCCSSGPTTSDFGPLSSEFRGKWWRFEGVITNRLGPGWRYQIFAKNVTDDLPERLVMDTNGTLGAGPFGPWVPSAQLTPNDINATGSTQLMMGIGMYRANATGNGGDYCTGYAAYSHYLFAQWPVDSGQRIGPAYEVEGGSGQPTTLPAPPTGLRIAAIWDQLLKVFSTLQ